MYNNKLQLYCSSDNNMRLRFGSSIKRLLQWHNYRLFILTMSMTPPQLKGVGMRGKTAEAARGSRQYLRRS
jgi:hypothetical protein